MALEINMSSIKYVSQSDHILCSKRPITFRVNPRALWEKLGKKNLVTRREKENTQQLLHAKDKIQAYRKILLRTSLHRVSVVMSSIWSWEKALLQRAGSVLKFTRRSFHELYSSSQGQIQDEFFPLLRTLPAQHSRRRHHTNIEPVKGLEIKSDGILHNVT